MFFALALWAALPPRPALARERVLLLQSYHHGLAWSEGIQKGVEQALASAAPGTELVIEFMDTARLSGPEARYLSDSALLAFLKAKLAFLRMNAVIAADNPALEFFLKHREELAPGVPLVFCGINNYSPEMTAGHGQVTGVAESPSFGETLEAALRLRPNASRLLILGEDTSTFRANKALLEGALERFPGRLEVEYLMDPDIGAMEEKLGRLGPAWLVLPMARPRESGIVMPALAGAGRIAAASPVPVLAGWDFWMGSGVLGGKVVSAAAQGVAAGRMAAEALARGSVSHVPVMLESPNVFEFDHAALRRFAVNEALLPPGSVVQGKPPGFYQANKALVHTYAVFTALLLSALTFLAVNVIRRSRAEERLESQLGLMGILLEALPNPVFQKDASGVYIACNKAFEEFFGLDREKVLGRTVSGVVKGGDALVYGEMDREVLSSGGLRTYEWVVNTASGPRQALFNKAAYRGADGKVAGLVGTITDITERKNAEEALRQSEERYVLALKGSNDGIWDWDLRLGRVYFSDRWKEIIGYAPHEIPDDLEEWKKRIHPDDMATILGANARCIRGEAPSFEVEYRLLHKDGGYRWILGRGAALKDESGKVIRMSGAHTDLTARKRAEEALRQSEEMFRTLFETMAQGVVYQDASGVVTSANPAALRILGLSMDEMQGRSSLDPRWRTIREDGGEFPGSEHPSMVALRTGRPVTDVTMGVYNPGDDSRRWIIVNAVPEFMPGQDKPFRVYACFEDITRQKLAEDALRESESRHRRLLATMLEGYASVDMEGRIKECNAAFRDMLGMTGEEILASSYEDITPAKWHGIEADIVREQVFVRGFSDVYAKEYRRKDGTVFPVELRTYLLRDDKGDASGMWAIVRDVTEQRRMQEAMVQTEKMMSVGGLAAGMAHEINNPLGGILQCSQVILSRLKGTHQMDKELASRAGCGMEAVRTYLESRDIFTLLDSVRDSAARAARIVSNMLEFSRRGDAGKMPFDLNLILDTAVELVSNDYDARKKYDFRKIEIVRRYAPDLPPVVCTPTQIEQVAVNILRNAAQAMAARPQGLEGGRIVLATSLDGSCIRAEIRDNGPGMDEEVRRKAFEPFFTTKKPGEGTGLGLSVSYYIITSNHDGTMDIVSSPGQGTAFIIRLPAASGEAV
ncbi:MAG: PAS domain S-box protein [Thermodesulfobacteriota bacterium]